MTQEITLAVSGLLANGSFTDQIPLLNLKPTQVYKDKWERAVPVATSPTAIVPSITTPGWTYLQNLDDTGTITIHFGVLVSGILYPIIELLPGDDSVNRPGEFALYRWDANATNLGAQATGGAGILQVKIWNQ